MAKIKKRRIYVSGKISAPTPEGMEENLRLLQETAEKLQAEHPEAMVYNPGANKQPHWNGDYDTYMRHDISVLSESEGIHMSENSPESYGARVEHRYARLKKIPRTYASDEVREKFERGRTK